MERELKRINILFACWKVQSKTMLPLAEKPGWDTVKVLVCTQVAAQAYAKALTAMSL